MNHAAGNGHLNVVKYLHEHRSEGCTDFAIDYAAKNGHLEVIKFLDKHRSEGCTRYAMDDAARNGHLEVVKYLHENRSEGCSRRAFESCSPQILQFLCENYYNIVKTLDEQTYNEKVLPIAVKKLRRSMKLLQKLTIIETFLCKQLVWAPTSSYIKRITNFDD